MESKEDKKDAGVYFHPEQVRYLEKIFPEVVPDASTPVNELYMRGGMRKVVYFVKSRMR